MSSNTASVIAVIIIGYSITDNMVCTEYKVLSQSSTVVSISFCTEYQCIGYVLYTVFKSMTCFQIPNDNQDTNLSRHSCCRSSKNPKTASNAVNKVRDLEVSAKAGAGWAQSGSYNWSHKVNKININDFQPFCLHCILLLCSDSYSTSWRERQCSCSSATLWSRGSSACWPCCKTTGRSKNKHSLTHCLFSLFPFFLYTL